MFAAHVSDTASSISSSASRISSSISRAWTSASRSSSVASPSGRCSPSGAAAPSPSDAIICAQRRSNAALARSSVAASRCRSARIASPCFAQNAADRSCATAVVSWRAAAFSWRADDGRIPRLCAGPHARRRCAVPSKSGAAGGTEACRPLAHGRDRLARKSSRSCPESTFQIRSCAACSPRDPPAIKRHPNAPDTSPRCGQPMQAPTRPGERGRTPGGADGRGYSSASRGDESSVRGRAAGERRVDRAVGRGRSGSCRVRRARGR
jgi:hypothetical protein